MAAAALPAKLEPPEITAMHRRSVTIEWTASGTPVKEYKIKYYRKVSNRNLKIIHTGTRDPHFTIRNLQGNPKEYEFRVAAVKGGVVGEFSDPGTLCSSCEAIHGQQTAFMRLKGNLEDAYHKHKTLMQFLKYANALLNGRAGNIVIHSSDHNLLERFDQKADPKLKDLISDGSMYHSVFERSYYDANHLVYRVKPSAGNRPFSTLDFKCKVSYNKGIEQPTYRNMSVCIDALCVNDPDTGICRDMEKAFVFELGEEVVLWKKKSEEEDEVDVFQESMTIQAKAIHMHAEGSSDQCLLRLKLAEHCWNTLKLKEYITAFTKIKGGGSVFVGVSEHKTKEAAWVLPDPTIVSATCPVGGEQWGVWQDKNAPDPPTVYHVAREVKTNECGTGKFITDAFQLTDVEKQVFRDDILHRVEGLKWVGAAEHSDVVQVHFHDVNINGNHAEDCYVIEIKVDYYHGLCFYDNEGPESYKCTSPASGSIFEAQPKLERIDVKDWIKSFKSGCDEHMDELRSLEVNQRATRCYFCVYLL